MKNNVIPKVSAWQRFIAFMSIIVFSMAACDTGILPSGNNSGGNNPAISLHPDEIRLNMPSLTLVVGGKETLTATVLPSDAANKAVTWNSSNSQVAAVASNGEVTGLSLGSATITATTTDGGKIATCAVSVIEAPPIDPTGVILFPPSLTLGVGDTDSLIVTVEPGNADKTVNWRSSNPAVVEVGADGNISAKSPGTASIYVSTVVGGKLATSEVTVIRFIPDTVEYVLGYGYDITGRYAYSPDTKAAVLDLDKLLVAKRIRRDPNFKLGEFLTITGNDINEYTENISVGIANSVNAALEKVVSFSREAGLNFSYDRITQAEYAFATSRSHIVNDAYHVADKNGLDAFLTQGFKNDLVSLSSEDLIEKYGTHVVLGAVLGARLDFNMSFKRKVRGKIADLGYYAREMASVAYEDLTIGKVTMGKDLSHKVGGGFEDYFYTDDAEMRINVVGGKTQYAQLIQNDQQYKDWIDSIEGSEVWVDYYPGTLVPISDLVTDSDRRYALAEAIINYRESMGFNVVDRIIEPKVFSDKESGETKFDNKDLLRKTYTSSFNITELRYEGFKYLTIELKYELKPMVTALGGSVTATIESTGILRPNEHTVKHALNVWRGFSLSTKVPLDVYNNQVEVIWKASSAGDVKIKNRSITITPTVN